MQERKHGSSGWSEVSSAFNSFYRRTVLRCCGNVDSVNKVLKSMLAMNYYDMFFQP
ncbi:MAG: hypothetical protein FGF51_02405 [Candidatus Brockarchaeota archaeon]|nr:hypothetical protein [Candidatus Brockarchaeota archaeon]